MARWRVESHGNWIIYITKNSVEIDDFPAIRDWLLPFKEKLEKRATKQEWFELQQAQEAYVPCFETPKIAYIEVCNKGPFTFEPDGFYQEATTFLIPSEDLSLLALLNSSVAWYFFVGTTTVFRGGYFRMKNQFVELLPIPDWDDAARIQLAFLAQTAGELASQRRNLQSAFTRRIADLCPPEREAKLTTKLKDWWKLPDFSAFRAEVKKAFKTDIPLAERSDWEDWMTRDRAEILRLDAEIKAKEAEIDAIVYDLFDLTEEEIALLEAAIS